MSVTQCPGGDGTSSVGLGSPGEVSTDSNDNSSTVPVAERAGWKSTPDVNSSFTVPAGSDTHVVYGRESLTEILDSMIKDFNDRWGNGSDVLLFQYGHTGSGKGQPCGYTPEQILQFTCDPHMINLPYGNDSVPDDK